MKFRSRCWMIVPLCRTYFSYWFSCSDFTCKTGTLRQPLNLSLLNPHFSWHTHKEDFPTKNWQLSIAITTAEHPKMHFPVTLCSTVPGTLTRSGLWHITTPKASHLSLGMEQAIHHTVWHLPQNTHTLRTWKWCQNVYWRGQSDWLNRPG